MAQIYPDIKRLFESVTTGRTPKYTPLDLIREFCEYVESLRNSPLEVETEYRQQSSASGESSARKAQVRRQRFDRPPKVYDFVVRWLGMSESWWRLLGTSKRYSKLFLTVKEKIERYCYDCKFDGAVIGVYNASIIARDLGLKDRVEYETTKSEDNMTLDEINAEIARLQKLYSASHADSSHDDADDEL